MKADRFDLTDRVAIVTGSGRGIGKGIAVGFAAMGSDVVVAERDAEPAETTAAEIRARRLSENRESTAKAVEAGQTLRNFSLNSQLFASNLRKFCLASPLSRNDPYSRTAS